VNDQQWTVVVAGPTARDLERLPEKMLAPILASFRALEENPYRVGKPLRFELEGLFSARRGSYRIVYAIDPERRTVTVVRVGHRSDVYRGR
jgi:mRNA interferase RelE/StbE